MSSEDGLRQKTVLFFPLNSPGHINTSLGIADRLKVHFKHRIVFLLLGPMISDSIRQHGHELVTLEETNPFEDYEICDDEDPAQPVDEQLMRRLGRAKQTFPGVFKWPQIIERQWRLLRLPPVDAFVETYEALEAPRLADLLENEQNYAAAIESIKPDLIIVDAHYVPACVVNQERVPWVRLHSENPLALLEPSRPDGTKPPTMVGERLYDLKERERLRSEEPDRWQSILDGWRQTNERLAATVAQTRASLERHLAERACREPLPPARLTHDSPHLNIYMFPQAIDYDQEPDLFRYPRRWFRCDSLMRKQATPSDSPALRAWAQRLGSQLINKEAVIYFSLGSLASGVAKQMRRFMEMLSVDKRRLYIVSKGVNGDRFELSPDNMLGADYVPQNYFLQRADLAIVHGGNKSVNECLYHGLPMIVLPVFADQLDNARRIDELGLGRWLDVFNCTQKELLGAIDELLEDEAMLARARQIGQAMQQRDDLSQVTNMLDKLMREGKLADLDFERS